MNELDEARLDAAMWAIKYDETLRSEWSKAAFPFERRRAYIAVIARWKPTESVPLICAKCEYQTWEVAPASDPRHAEVWICDDCKEDQ